MLLTIEATQSGATVYGIVRTSANLVANGTGTEAYNESHWASLYAISASEQGTSGNYYLTVPAYLLPADNYAVTFYQQLDGSPATSDTKLGSQNFDIPTTTPSPTVPTANISRLRILANDTATANLIQRETLKPKPDSTRKIFYLDYQNLVTASVYVTQGNTDAGFRSQSGFSVDYTNGIVTFSAAPTTGVNPFEADYNFNWFTDTDYAEFLSEAAKQLSVLTADDVPSGLSMALMQFALFYFWQRRATQYAHRYASTGGLSSQSVDTVTKNFRDLAKLAWDTGTKFRNDYYTKQGQQQQPVVSVFNYGISPYTPKR